MNLEDFFKENKKLAIAFSGGTDSAYLLYEAKRFGADVCAYFVKSEFQPEFELNDAVSVAKLLDVELKIIHTDLLSDERIAANPKNRCYYCKKHIFSLISEQAARDGYDVIADGTNASDDMNDRPGMRALAELGVLSPLRMCGITKLQIRSGSRAVGLFTGDKPAYACLATRIAHGERITAEKLAAVERSEAFLHTLGFRDFRVRVAENTAKIQLRESQLPLLLEHRTKIITCLKKYYDNVLLDLEVRE